MYGLIECAIKETMLKTGTRRGKYESYKQSDTMILIYNKKTSLQHFMRLPFDEMNIC